MTLQSWILTVSIHVCCLELTNRQEAQQKLYAVFKKRKDSLRNNPTGRDILLWFCSWGLLFLVGDSGGLGSCTKPENDVSGAILEMEYIFQEIWSLSSVFLLGFPPHPLHPGDLSANPAFFFISLKYIFFFAASAVKFHWIVILQWYLKPSSFFVVCLGGVLHLHRLYCTICTPCCLVYIIITPVLLWVEGWTSVVSMPLVILILHSWNISSYALKVSDVIQYSIDLTKISLYKDADAAGVDEVISILLLKRGVSSCYNLMKTLLLILLYWEPVI